MKKDKECIKCLQIKSPDNFREGMTCSYVFYHSNICKKCEGEARKSPKAKKRRKEWEKECRERNPEVYRKMQLYYSNYHSNMIMDSGLTRSKEMSLKSNYNLSPEEYLQMIDSQDNLCAICGESETSKDARTDKVRCLSVDHHHESGRVRGLLCNKCNTGIGMFRDDIKLLESAIEYLKTK